jgi:hypothetical protein
VIGVALGVVAYWRYTVSEKHLHAAFDAIEAQGPTLTTEQCVDTVLAWHQRCEAMQSLCDHAVPMAMEHCLHGRDRAPFCSTIDTAVPRSKWTYERCKERGVSPLEGSPRRAVKACGDAYGAVESFCHYEQKGVVL